MGETSKTLSHEKRLQNSCIYHWVWYRASNCNINFTLKIETMIRVFFEKTGVAELAAVFTDERLYKDCLPAIQRIAKDQGFDKVTELYEDSIASDIITDTLSQKDFLPVINR